MNLDWSFKTGVKFEMRKKGKKANESFYESCIDKSYKLLIVS